jgi:hypothetical protein
VQQPGLEVDHVPSQSHKLRDSESVPVRNQDHGGITVAVAPNAPSCRYEALHLLSSEVFPRPKLFVGSPNGDFPVYDDWALRP